MPRSYTLPFISRNLYVLNYHGKRLNANLLVGLYFSILNEKHIMHISVFCKILKLSEVLKDNSHLVFCDQKSSISMTENSAAFSMCMYLVIPWENRYRPEALLLDYNCLSSTNRCNSVHWCSFLPTVTFPCQKTFLYFC